MATDQKIESFLLEAIKKINSRNSICEEAKKSDENKKSEEFKKLFGTRNNNAKGICSKTFVTHDKKKKYVTYYMYNC